MNCMSRRLAALCLLVFCLLGLTACGGSSEFSVVGEVIAVSQREAAVRLITPDEMEGVPYDKRMDGVKTMVFSTEIIDNFGAEEGDIVTVLCRGDVSEDETVWVEALSWSPYNAE